MKPGVESELIKLFVEHKKILSKIDGFVSRRLLKSVDGKHRMIVEHRSKETFMNMTKCPEHKKIHDETVPFMVSHPKPKIFEVIFS